MGGYKKHNPSVYVVRWPDGVLKVGYTEKQRWRKFALLGAELLAVYEFASHVPAFGLESVGLSFLARFGEPAFETIDDSYEHVGPDGGGYRECYRLTSVYVGANELLEHMLEHELSNARIRA